MGNVARAADTYAAGVLASQASPEWSSVSAKGIVFNSTGGNWSASPNFMWQDTSSAATYTSAASVLNVAEARPG